MITNKECSFYIALTVCIWIDLSDATGRTQKQEISTKVFSKSEFFGILKGLHMHSVLFLKHKPMSYQKKNFQNAHILKLKWYRRLLLQITRTQGTWAWFHISSDFAHAFPFWITSDCSSKLTFKKNQLYISKKKQMKGLVSRGKEWLSVYHTLCPDQTRQLFLKKTLTRITITYKNYKK